MTMNAFAFPYDLFPDNVQVYEVGGAVRDALLGKPVADRDFVVVGATPGMMLHAGFRSVGKDFPVFLHPQTHDEYALARTERKTGLGYHGFTFHTAPDVTLEEDLRRRDLTINAMARDAQGKLIDPFGGQADIESGVLRHVSAAFAEDPLRVLRVARFAASLGFTVANKTMTMMHGIAASQELKTLSAERVWQETARALMSDLPSRFLQVLYACGALKDVMPEVYALYGVPQEPEHHPEIDAGIHVEEVLDAAARFAFSLPVRYALLCHDLGKATTPAAVLPNHRGHEERGVSLAQALSVRLKAPRQCIEAAQVVTRWHGEMLKVFDVNEHALLALLRGCDAIRRPDHLHWLVDASYADSHTHVEKHGVDERGDYLKAALEQLRAIDIPQVIRNAANRNIPLVIQEKQRDVLRAFIAQHRKP